MDEMKLQKVPRLAVYAPKNILPWDDAVTLGGYNIKLAGKLTGYDIDVYRNSDEVDMEDDVDLKEFNDEIEDWIIDSLRRMGCDTAKNVLAYTPEEVASRADLEIETVNEVFRILKAEFAED